MFGIWNKRSARTGIRPGIFLIAPTPEESGSVLHVPFVGSQVHSGIFLPVAALRFHELYDLPFACDCAVDSVVRGSRFA